MTGAGILGSDRPRIDGIAKVTGKARYAADERVPNAAYAYLATAPIARGRIRKIDCSAARSMPGVLEVLTHENVGKCVEGGTHMLSHGHMATAFAPLGSSHIAFAGQIVAVVVAETFEIAQEAAAALHIEYSPARRPAAGFDDRGARKVKPKSMGEPELSAGNFKKAFRSAAAKVDSWYETPAQHHNPLELFQTTCAWTADDQLTVWESSQNCAVINTVWQSSLE